MYRKRFKGPGNNIPSVLMILAGVILIAWWMPLWVWFVLIGMVLIVIGAALYK